MKAEIKEVKARLLKVSQRLTQMARQGTLSEVFLIRFDQELIRAIDAIEMLELLAK